MLAGLAGALFAHQQGYIVSDTFTFDKSVELLVFVILGGARSLFGPLIGATVLVILPEVLKTVELVRRPAEVADRRCRLVLVADRHAACVDRAVARCASAALRYARRY